jgi:hypothetical protein
MFRPVTLGAAWSTVVVFLLGSCNGTLSFGPRGGNTDGATGDAASDLGPPPVTDVGSGGGGGGDAGQDTGPDLVPDTGRDAGTDARGPFNCIQDADCGLPGLHCLGSPGQPGTCAECVGDSHCPNAGARKCDPQLHRCVECVAAADCPPSQSSYPSTCTSVSRRCLPGCSDDSAAARLCPTTRAYSCNEELYLCIECLTNANCAASPSGTLCHPSEYVCVQCLTGTCGGGQSCDAITGRCVQCRSSADCTSPGAPLCDPSTHTCVAIPAR